MRIQAFLDGPIYVYPNHGENAANKIIITLDSHVIGATCNAQSIDMKHRLNLVLDTFYLCIEVVSLHSSGCVLHVLG